MLYRYQSVSLTSLRDTLSGLLAATPGNNVFSERWLVVQNKDMGRWLTYHEASALRISANNRYILPSELLWMLYRLKKPELPRHLPSDSVPLLWSIFETAGRRDFLSAEDIPDINRTDPLQLYRFSASLADVFDVYQMYRPEMINAWQRGERQYGTAAEHWQAAVWHSVKKQAGAGLPDRAAAVSELLEWLQNGEFPVQQLPENIYVFGLSALTRPESDLLAVLSGVIDVHLFNHLPEAFNPDSEFFAFLGPLIEPALERDSVFAQSVQKFPGSVKDYSLPGPEHKPSILSSIKNSIHGQGSGAPEKTASGDMSFSIHSCHSIKREAEVLKDTLLAALDANPELKADDVLILVPDIKSYGTVLSGVFKGSEEEPGLPVAAGYAGNEPVYTVFRQILTLLPGSFNTSDIISLTEHPVIAYKLGFGSAELSKIRKWVAGLNIRSEKSSRSFSWSNGLTNLMLGYAMEPEGTLLCKEQVPYGKMEESEEADTASVFSLFVRKLLDYAGQIKNDRTVVQWLDFCMQLAAECILPAGSYDNYRAARLLSELEDLKEQTEAGPGNPEIDFFIFREWISRQLSGESAGSGGFGHGMVLSSYIPNRGIPFKFIALLGFNEDTFPRRPIRPDFDLVHRHPAPGDRIMHKDDGYLFYQILMAAEEYLHISYIGQSVDDNSNSLPSILLQQLTSMLSAQGYSKILPLTEHKLYGFSPAYFEHSGKLNSSQSYSSKNAGILNHLLRHNGTSVPLFTGFSVSDAEAGIQEPIIIELQDLLDFYQRPSEFLANRLLGARLIRDEETAEDRESFALRGLDNYKAKVSLIDHAAEISDLTPLRRYLQAEGRLPAALPGTWEFEALAEEISPLMEVAAGLHASDKQIFEKRIDTGRFQISGAVPDIYGTEQILVRVNEIKGRHLIEFWIRHLFLQAAGADFERSLLYHHGKGKKPVALFKLGSVEAAASELNKLTEYFLAGMESPAESPWLPETACAFAQELRRKQGDREAALKSAEKAWKSDDYTRGEESNYYNHLLWNGLEPYLNEELLAAAEEIWAPVLGALKKEEV